MAGVTLDKLPPALGLNGGELLWAYQEGGDPVVPWVGVQLTTAQLAAYVQNGPNYPVASTTMRQLLSALQTLGLLYSTFRALPSNITNIYNIAWYHSSNISINDVFITGFLQPQLGYSDEQMQELFAVAGSIPTYSVGTVTMRQLIAAMANESTLVNVFNALNSDITNTYNIAWNHANYMPITDPFITGFLQPTLGYSSSQMQALYAYASTLPA